MKPFSNRKKLPVYIFQGLLIGTPLILSIIFAFSMYVLYNKLLTTTETLLEKGREQIVHKEIEFREDLFRRALFSVYSELWKNFPEYEKTLLEKNIYSAKEFLRRKGLEEMLHYRVMYGSGIVYYVDPESGDIYHPHRKQPISMVLVRDDRGEPFILEGVEKAKKQGGVFVRYEMNGEKKLAFFEYLPSKDVVLVTSGTESELRKNYKHIVKTIMGNMIRAISR